MIIKNLFFADDGKQFATEEACVAYENGQLLDVTKGKILLFDSDMNDITHMLYEYDNDSAQEEAIGKCFSCYLEDDETAEVIHDFACDRFGIDMPIKSGKYTYLNGYENWLRLNDIESLFDALNFSISALKH